MSVNALSGISCLTAPIMQKCLHLSPACSFCLLAGFLCGFPMGTAVSVQAFENGLISRKEAQLLSGSAIMPAPCFLGGYILDQILPDHPLHSCLILIFYASPFLWFLLRCFFLHHPPASVRDRAVAKNTRPSAPLPFRTILLNASELMLKIGVCMMIFSILQAIIGNLPFVPASLSAVLALFLEITSGSAAVRLLPLQLCLKTRPDHGWHSLRRIMHRFPVFCTSSHTKAVLRSISGRQKRCRHDHRSACMDSVSDCLMIRISRCHRNRHHHIHHRRFLLHPLLR